MWLVAWLLAALLCCVPVYAQNQALTRRNFPPDAAAYLVKADGRVLWAKAADQPLPPASLTKMMTALLVVEGNDPGAVVTVGTAAARESGSRLGLHRGERLTVADLLAATLIQSANDACHALADHVAGNEQRFVVRMNRRARAWGLAETHFANACGHDQPGHTSSARDLAVLAERALARPELARLMAAASMEIRSLDGSRHYQLHNKNLLIGRFPGAVGVKTGFTARAGKCLVGAARQDGHEVLLVMLNAPNRWWDAVEALERAFFERQFPAR